MLKSSFLVFKGIYDFVDHKTPKKLSDLFIKYYDFINKYIDNKIERFNNAELKLFTRLNMIIKKRIQKYSEKEMKYYIS